MIKTKKNVDKLLLFKSMRRIKHYLVLIAFGVPITFFLLNLYVWVKFNLFLISFFSSADSALSLSLYFIIHIFSYFHIVAVKMGRNLFKSESNSTYLVFSCANHVFYIDIHGGVCRKN